jgi:hypothetical protein
VPTAVLLAQAGARLAWRTSPPCGGSVGCLPKYGADPQVVPYLLYEDAGVAMDWLIRLKMLAWAHPCRDSFDVRQVGPLDA